MATKDRVLGLLLFSGTISLALGRHLNIRFGWLFNRDEKKEHKTGEFILNGKSRHFTNGDWKDFVSTEEGEQRDEECEIEVVNNLKESLVFCWVDYAGKLHHFNQINDNSIKDGSVSNRHVEFASTHHAFLCLRTSPSSSSPPSSSLYRGSGIGDDDAPKFLSEVSDDQFVFIYKPTLASFRHCITISNSRRVLGTHCHAHIACKKMKSKSAVLDTSKKVYVCSKICDFIVYYEPDVFDTLPTLRQLLTEDLKKVNSLLPNKARKQLQRSTPLWLNRTITFGTVDEPVVGNTCCFHPKGDRFPPVYNIFSHHGEEWLKRNGMRMDKAGGIEVYCAQEYLDSRTQWGVGGLLLHELSHAFHNKFCPEGYDCLLIRTAFTQAMNKKLYDSVAVHGRKGLQKAYACANCMEFFAELSVAFLYQNSIDNPTLEYNKWYPHNYIQLFQHDPSTCEVLSTIWGLQDEEKAKSLSYVHANDLFMAT